MITRKPVAIALSVGVLLLWLATGCGPAATPEPTVPPTPVPSAPEPTPVPTALEPTPVPTALEPTPTVVVAEGPVAGGTMVLYVGAKQNETDPHMAAIGSKRLWEMIGNSFAEYDWQNSQVLPGLVESWDVSDDHLELTLHVREGVYFHNKPPVNGRELTAEDIAFSLMRITGRLNPDLPPVSFPRRGTLVGLEKAEAVDKYTVKVTLAEPSAGFLFGLADPHNIVIPKELVDYCGGNLNDAMKCSIGTGPFVLTAWEDGVAATFVRNDKYWKEGMPYLDEVQFAWITDKAAAIASVVSGETVFYERLTPTDVEALRQANAPVEIVNYNGGIRYSGYFNVTRPPFDDVSVRRAISMVINRAEILDFDLGPGLWTYGTALTSDHAYMIPPEELEARPGIRPPTEADITEAIRLLTEAGYGSDNPLEFTIITAPARTCGENCPLLMKDQIEKAIPFVKVSIENLEPAQRSERNAARDFDFSWSALATVLEPGAYLQQTYATDGAWNFPGYSNPEMDQLIEQQSRELDPENRLTLIREIQEIGLEDMPTLIIGSGMRIAMMSPRLRGWIPGPDTAGGDIYYQIEQVYWSEGD